MSSNQCIYINYGGGDHKWQTKAAWGVCLQAKVRDRGLRLRPRLNTGSVCDNIVQLWHYTNENYIRLVTFCSICSLYNITKYWM